MPMTAPHLANLPRPSDVLDIVKASPRVRKATVALYGAAAGTLGTSMLDGRLTLAEFVASLGAGIVASAGVFGFANRG